MIKQIVSKPIITKNNIDTNNDVLKSSNRNLHRRRRNNNNKSNANSLEAATRAARAAAASKRTRSSSSQTRSHCSSRLDSPAQSRTTSPRRRRTTTTKTAQYKAAAAAVEWFIVNQLRLRQWHQVRPRRQRPHKHWRRVRPLLRPLMPRPFPPLVWWWAENRPLRHHLSRTMSSRRLITSPRIVVSVSVWSRRRRSLRLLWSRVSLLLRSLLMTMLSLNSLRSILSTRRPLWVRFYTVIYLYSSGHQFCLWLYLLICSTAMIIQKFDYK